MDIICTDENTEQFLDKAGMAFMVLMTHGLNQVLKGNVLMILSNIKLFA
ncbi:MAG: hypothetical protein SFY66_03795 [Oculatellaceae cyanobacterium bins.114]|nr:hypothetical protein [Oculatellaceae cyanobacterium bins.114]